MKLLQCILAFCWVFLVTLDVQAESRLGEYYRQLAEESAQRDRASVTPAYPRSLPNEPSRPVHGAVRGKADLYYVPRHPDQGPLREAPAWVPVPGPYWEDSGLQHPEDW